MGCQLYYAITTLAEHFIKLEFIQLCFGEYIYLLSVTDCGSSSFSEEKARLLDFPDFFLSHLDHVLLPWTFELMSLLPILLSAHIAAVNN